MLPGDSGYFERGWKTGIGAPNVLDREVAKGKANFVGVMVGVARARSASRPGNAPHSSLQLGRRPWRSKSLGTVMEYHAIQLDFPEG